jgi:hypothetical protein
MADIRVELIRSRGAALHDQLEAEGFSIEEIVIIGSGITAVSLGALPPEERLKHFEANLSGLTALGLEIDHHGRTIVREVGHG